MESIEDLSMCEAVEDVTERGSQRIEVDIVKEYRVELVKSRR